MTPSNEPRYGIEELADLGGVTRRTVRYYVQRGLLPAPTGTGRGQHYTQQHLETLIRIRQLQEAGVALAEIPDRLAAPGGGRVEPGLPPPEPGPEPGPLPGPPWMPPVPSMPWPGHGSLWTRIVLDDGLELHVRGRHDWLHPLQLAQLRESIAKILGPRTNP